MEYNGFLKLGLVTRLVICLLALQCVCAEVSYTVPEEMKPGTVIGNIAKDLSLDISTLSTRKARIDFEGNNERFFVMNLKTGDVSVAERLDRESLCGAKPSCISIQDLVLENPLELNRIHFHIQDINDNSPQFKRDLIRMEISESVEKGTRFSIEEAHDADIGQNSVQRYTLQKNNNFKLMIDANKLCRRSYVCRSTTASLPVFPTTYCPPSFTDLSRCGTLLKDDRYDSFLTTGSWRGDFRFASSTDTDTLKKRSAAYQKSTLRRTSADRATLKGRAGVPHPFYVVQ
ncbi:hypothetical protein F2P81_007952 [Scophthalmus maximus]|uniref:Cadherin domain-containing protein n=1 Tax=Scophthalmus maximus TaxID=52904 RepID=A0A6A4T0Z7_SCOMX|nr:hypothetical protein F2P81_007952 [Scophthalmus maximus]